MSNDAKTIIALGILGAAAFYASRSMAAALPQANADSTIFTDVLPSWFATDESVAPAQEQPAAKTTIDADPWITGFSTDETDTMSKDETAGGDSVEGEVILAGSIDQATRNLSAFLKIIRVLESQDDYYAVVGNGQTGGFARVVSFLEHPWVLNPNMPLIQPFNSNASGAYQFLSSTATIKKPMTWQIARDAAGVHDFSPTSQDKAAIAILKFPWRNGAYNDVVAGRFDMAMSKLTQEWESFAKVLAGQYSYALNDVKQIYKNNGGIIAGATV